MKTTTIMKTLAMIVLYVLLAGGALVNAAPPSIPAAIFGSVTVDGSPLTAATSAGYTVNVSNSSGTVFADATGNKAECAGLDSDNQYNINIPIGGTAGAQTGANAVVHVYKNGVALTVTNPPGGTFTVGDSGTFTELNLGASSSGQGSTTSVSGGNTTTSVESSLVAYYPFNGNANDESGNGNNGTVLEAVLVNDRFNNPNSAYSLNGEDQYIYCGKQNIFNINDQITISAWIKHNTGVPNEFEAIVKKGTYGYGLKFNGDANVAFILDDYNLQPLDSFVNPSAGVWYHFVGTYDGQEQKIYVNGVLKNTDSFTGRIEAEPDSPLAFGAEVSSAYPTVYFFYGSIDDIRIYSRALSKEEVLQLYSGSSAPSTTTTTPGSVTTTIPGGTTTSTVPGNVTTTTVPGGGGCPAKTVMGQDNPHLNTLRAFRNEMLLKPDEGKQYIALFYKHAIELSNIFAHSEKLKDKATMLIKSIMPAIGSLLAKREAVIAEGSVQKSIELIDDLTAQASPALEKDLIHLKQDIQNGGIFNALRVKIKK